MAGGVAVAGDDYYDYGGHRAYKHGYHRHHHRHRRHSKVDGDAVAIVAGVVVGALVLDAILDDRRRNTTYHRAYPPAPPPKGYSTSYRRAGDPYAADGWSSAPDGRTRPIAGSAGAVEACADEAGRLLSYEGAVNSYVRGVTAADRLEGGVWRVEMDVIAEWRGAASVRPVLCEASDRGVQSVRLG